MSPFCCSIVWWRSPTSRGPCAAVPPRSAAAPGWTKTRFRCTIRRPPLPYLRRLRMKATLGTILLAVCALPAAGTAQTSQPIIVVDGVPVDAGAPVLRRGVDALNPVSNAFRSIAQRQTKNITDAAEAMPADKYGFKPTPAQMSFGDVVAHLIQEGNDELCSAYRARRSRSGRSSRGRIPRT